MMVVVLLLALLLQQLVAEGLQGELLEADLLLGVSHEVGCGSSAQHHSGLGVDLAWRW